MPAKSWKRWVVFFSRCGENAQRIDFQVATLLLANVEPFVAHANELLADPANQASRQATVHDLKTMMAAAERVGNAKKARPAIQEFIPQLMDCATNMMDIEASTPEGQKEALRMQSTLNDISRAVKLTDMGPHTGMMNQLVELHKGEETKEKKKNQSTFFFRSRFDGVCSQQSFCEASWQCGSFRRLGSAHARSAERGAQDAAR